MATKLEIEQVLMRDRLATERATGQKVPVRVQRRRMRYIQEAFRPARNISKSVDCEETPVRELLVPLISGVYLLHEDGVCYIGESGNIMGRLATHVENIGLQKLTAMKNPRCCLLMEIKPFINNWKSSKEERLTAEDRFIVAALDMGLKLTNKLSDSIIAKCRARTANLECETSRLQAALALLG